MRRDARVLLGVGSDDKVNVFSVSNVSGAGFVALGLGLENRFYAFTCTRRDSKTNSVCRIRTLVIDISVAVLISHFHWLSSLEALASFNFTNPRQLLFFAEWNSTTSMHAIVSLRASRRELSEKRELLVAEAGVFVAAWILAGDRLVSLG